jgi:hypothetical protein
MATLFASQSVMTLASANEAENENMRPTASVAQRMVLDMTSSQFIEAGSGAWARIE